MTQRQCLVDLDGEVNFDFIGRFENFIPDLRYVLYENLGLPRRNICSVHNNASDNTLLNMNNEDIIHKDDFIEFNY